MPTLSDNELTLRIKAIDEATSVLNKVRDELDGATESSKKNSSIAEKLRDNWAPIAAVTAAAGGGFFAVTSAINGTIDSANKYTSALAGLDSIAAAFGVSQDKAKKAAQQLSSDGLMSVTDAATGLKNLLASGFSLDQAVTLMNRFKDSAAFGRQSSLEFGEAVASATEGIKNGNSILVDNAGVTKNLSMMLTDAGYSAQDLMKASSDAGVRQAIFNGIVSETNAQMGDASKLADSFAGAQARAAAASDTLKANLGGAIQQALAPLLQRLTPIIDAVSKWVSENQKLVAALAIGVTLFLGMAAAIGLVAGIIALVGSTAVLVFGGIVAAVAAAVAALIVYWEPISGFFAGIWDNIKSAVGVALEWIGQKATWLKDHFFEVIGFIIGFFATLPIKLPIFVFQAIGAIIGWLASINWGQVFSAIGSAFGAVWQSVKDAASSAWNFIKSINWGAVLSSVGKGIGNAIIGLIEGAINGALSGLPGAPKISLPRFARGTNFAPGGLAIVGEEGPEIVNLPRGSQVKTAGETQAILGGGGGQTVTNNLTGTFIFNDQAAVDGFFNRLDRTQRLTRSGMA